MASELRVTTIANNAGTESVDTTYVVNGSAKAWSNYNTITNTARDTFNISGLTDNGTGDHTFSISNAFSNADYAVSALGQEDTGGGARIISGKGTPTSSQRQVDVNNLAGAAKDLGWHNLTFHGDLA